MVALKRVLFFGTPEFAVPTLEALVAGGRAPTLVVTQPARPAGRGQEARQPAVAVAAARLGLPLEQPVKVRDPAFIERVRALDVDVAVVIAFGQIFPQALLDQPRHGCINVHASLLPAWRGAAPIATAIAAGDTVTGVTTMLMEAGLDTGPMLLSAETPIGARETAGELEARLARIGAALLTETLDRLERGDLRSTPQEASRATLAPKLDRAQAAIDFSDPGPRVAARIRALSPWPGAETRWRDEVLKLWGAWTLAAPAPGGAAPGQIVAIGGEGDAPSDLEDGLAVACGDGTMIAISPVQRAGRKRLPGNVFARGERLQRGEGLAALAKTKAPPS